MNCAKKILLNISYESNKLFQIIYFYAIIIGVATSENAFFASKMRISEFHHPNKLHQHSLQEIVDMEYERALFRVYERLMDSVVEISAPGSVSKSCRAFEYLILLVGLLCFTCLVILHVSFVGDAGCLPQLLSEYSSIYHNSTSFNFSNDQILQISIDTSDSFFLRRLNELEVFNETHPGTYSDNSSLTVLEREAKPDFEFAKSWSVLHLDSAIRRSHSFELINISLSADECFGGSLQQLLLPLGGVSTVVANNIQGSLSSDGVLKVLGGDSLSWGRGDTDTASVPSRLFNKIAIVLSSIFSFFVLSTTTAILVRVLISSGVVLLFPVFGCLQVCAFRCVRVCAHVNIPTIYHSLKIYRDMCVSVFVFPTHRLLLLECSSAGCTL